MRELARPQENAPPAIGAPDSERPEAAKARLFEHHKRDGTLGAFFLMYGNTGRARDEKKPERKADNRELEVSNPAPQRGRGLER
jgi:hypothetical protein